MAKNTAGQWDFCFLYSSIFHKWIDIWLWLFRVGKHDWKKQGLLMGFWKKILARKWYVILDPLQGFFLNLYGENCQESRENYINIFSEKILAQDKQVTLLRKWRMFIILDTLWKLFLNFGQWKRPRVGLALV